MGVTTTKKIIPIIKGDNILPKSKPNLNHSLFRGDKTLDLVKPNIKKTNEIINAQIYIFSSFSKG